MNSLFLLILLGLVSVGFAQQSSVESQAVVSEGNQQSAASDAADRQAAQTIVRRQEMIFRAQQAIDDAGKSVQNEDLLAAQERYRFALTTIPKGEGTEVLNKTASRGLSVVNVALAKSALETQKIDEARKLLDEAVSVDPSNEKAKNLLEDVKRVETDPASVAKLYNPALTPALKQQVQTVENLFVEAEQYRLTGQFDEAKDAYKKILAIDPYNKTAANKLEKLYDEMQVYADKSRLQAREKRILETEQKWTTNSNRKKTEDKPGVELTPISKSKKFEITEKLRKIRIDEIKLNRATIEGAVALIRAKSRSADPEKQGIQIVIKDEVRKSAKEIDLTLRDVPLSEVVRYVGRLADVKFRVEEYALVVVPLTETTENLVSRVFTVSPTFIEASEAEAEKETKPARKLSSKATAETSQGQSDKAKEALKQKGVEFPPGSSALYSPTQGTLTVLNTQDQIDLIEELVNADSGQQTLLVDVQLKFIEVNQTDLNEITSNVIFNTLNIANPLERTPTFQSQLRGSQGFTGNGVDSLINQGNTGIAGARMATPNMLRLVGKPIFDGVNAQLLLSLLAQKKSSDILSSPSVRVKQGFTANLVASRRFFYPTAFNEPKAPETKQATGVSTVSIFAGIAIVPAFPTQFESRDIGVTMKVAPQIASDKQTIELALQPELVEFEGFVNYGTPIFASGTPMTALRVPTGSPVTTILSPNTMNQPIFSTRRITTKVFVRDKFTAVLAGLIREDVQDVQDKVPFLGDIPLVGNLFRSSARQSVKKNLLIFVTPKILLPDGTPFNLD